MTLTEFYLEQLELEAAATRKMLSRVPTDKFNWKPHEKSMEMIRLATHVAELPTWIPMTLDTDELDFAANPYNPVQLKNTEELIAYFEKCQAEGVEALKKGRDEVMDKPWTLRNGETVYDISPKRSVIRMALSQITHHRAQLGVYLRLLDIPIPGSYGPSADENDF